MRIISTSRSDILALLHHQRGERVPCFSGLINITSPGLDSLGYRFAEIHTDPVKMARAAATTHALFGFESAVVPADLCVEAGALGAQIDFRDDEAQPMWPFVSQPLAASAQDFSLGQTPALTRRERIAVVLEAIRLLKASVGPEAVVGAWVPGPFTLATQVIALDNLMMDVARAPNAVARALDSLTDVLIIVANAYREAGADFLTVHEMGGSPGVIGPNAFKKLLLPRLQKLIAALPKPRVLSVCGNTNHAMDLLAAAGADALSVEQTNDLARSREVLGRDAILFGNIDPVATLAEDDETGVRRAVEKAIDAGVDAVWPGCDLWPGVPSENMRAMVDATQRHRR